MNFNRTVSWFSCGAASAVATKLARTAFCGSEPGRRYADDFVIAYCEVKEEHPDNMRFLKDCEKWFGQEILILGNDDYNRSIYEVFRRTRYLKGPTGARCTTELKKNVRKAFQLPSDELVFGFTAEETDRLARFEAQNAECHSVWPILIENGLDHSDCLAMVERAGIEIPAMYRLGYRNNNCIGCVKGEAGYWNKIRRDFPETFDRMAATEADLGRTVCKREWTDDGKRVIERFPLTDLDPGEGSYPNEPDMECSLFCVMAEDQISGSRK